MLYRQHNSSISKFLSLHINILPNTFSVIPKRRYDIFNGVNRQHCANTDQRHWIPFIALPPYNAIYSESWIFLLAIFKLPHQTWLNTNHNWYSISQKIFINYKAFTSGGQLSNWPLLKIINSCNLNSTANFIQLIDIHSGYYGKILCLDLLLILADTHLENYNRFPEAKVFLVNKVSLYDQSCLNSWKVETKKVNLS